MSWPWDDWTAAAASPDWGVKVARALRRYFDAGKWLFRPVRLVGTDTEADSDGVAVLLATYEQPDDSRRIGLRRRLDHPPMSDHGEASLEAAQAAEIAVHDISEPLGRYANLLVEDANGIWWWGDGYPN